ncbi:YdbC family protein [Streptococcus suis]|uniref:Transcriptional coactivator p15 (PC4) C-terminal domain-containing protein n=1 Tax=Streptococcus suis TaxID=1307 RepID=A0A3R8N1B8_STRSU|nr:PC4/YdbC family ssDNA-binding protein [Streptococcus suis]MBY4967184.1 hypothetical protein [Streptococcus suis]MDW8778452.1 PC4/YdbC family ssDNA-binding protein [Streptococcus suis]RRN51163.1 hypothetical protein EI220_05210 [Streptococcus suis]RRR47817.1 hypothetical protein EJA00_07100 [Streptococcus suis]TIH99096.1 hypothetical protein FAJ35_11025 [Streptococcus suis]
MTEQKKRWTDDSAKSEITFELVEHICVLSTNDKGWSKELNKVSWNGAPAKYDIRSWNQDRTRKGKGITLTDEEFSNLIQQFK